MSNLSTKPNKWIVVVGKSGSGKNYFLDKIIERGLATRHVCYTTRKQRVGEVDGSEYHFISEAKFDSMVEEMAFIEWTFYNVYSDGDRDTWYYGTPFPDYGTGKVYATIVAVNRLKEFSNVVGKDNVSIIYIDAPYEIRRNRILDRPDYDEQEFARREIDETRCYTILTSDFVKSVCNNFYTVEVYNDETSNINDILEILGKEFKKG